MDDGPTAERRFFGRQGLTDTIVRGLRVEAPARFSIVGSSLIGKTALLQHLASAEATLAGDGHGSNARLVVYVDCSGPQVIAQPDAVIADYLARHFAAAGGPQEYESFGGNRYAQDSETMRACQRIAANGMQPVLLLDNFDSLLIHDPETGDRLGPLPAIGQEIWLVTTSKQPLFDLDANRASSRLVDSMTQLFLGLLAPGVAQDWVAYLCQPHAELLPASGALLEMTGMHPFLLGCLGHTLAGVSAMLMPDQRLNAEHLPLIHLRLSEHARPLFVRTWQEIQNPPERVDLRALVALLKRMLRAPVRGDELTAEQAPALNWLINQAVIMYGVDGYQIASPLFADFLNQRLGAQATRPARSQSGNGHSSPFFNSLTKTEAVLLRYFQENSNVIISPEELLADVWNRPDASPRRVQEAIRRLRLRLDDAVPPVGAIENERGRGYRFVPARL